MEKSLWQIPHGKLLSDATKGAPGLLEFDRSITGRLMGSSRSHASLMGVSKLPRDETPMIRAFRTKLQKVCVPNHLLSLGVGGRGMKCVWPELMACC